MKTKIFSIIILLMLCPFLTFAQRHNRYHTTTQSHGADLITSSKMPGKNQVQIREENGKRYIISNGIPNHKVGNFPNSGNPNSISTQSYRFEMPLSPKLSGEITKVDLPLDFGVALNGVPFDPGAAEFYKGNRGGWQYEALSGAVALGIDDNHAHVQPTGAYHYHGLPTRFLKTLNPGELVGYAADGFPIFDGRSSESSSYQLKSGQRPGGDNPSGTYDGTFVQDYRYTKGSGTLDECNGKILKNGTYAYFLTKKFPVIPRCFKGTPDSSFYKKMENNANQDRSSHRKPRGQPRPSHRHGPPQEAITACAGKRVGSSCEFSHGPRHLNGTCFSPPHSNELACRPRH